jgi:hypothetical protein
LEAKILNLKKTTQKRKKKLANPKKKLTLANRVVSFSKKLSCKKERERESLRVDMSKREEFMPAMEDQIWRGETTGLNILAPAEHQSITTTTTTYQKMCQ